MTYTVAGLLLLLVIAAVCGAIGRALAGGVRGKLIASTVLGFIGALVGPWIAARFTLPEPLALHISGHPFPVLWSIIGAALSVAIIHLVSRRQVTGEHQGGPRRTSWSGVAHEEQGTAVGVPSLVAVAGAGAIVITTGHRRGSARRVWPRW